MERLSQQFFSLQPLLLHLPAVMQITGLPRSTIYNLMATEQFPKPLKVSLRAVAWQAADITQWIATRKRAHQTPNAQALRSPHRPD